MLRVRMEPRQFDAIREVAIARKTSISDLVRQFIEAIDENQDFNYSKR